MAENGWEFGTGDHGGSDCTGDRLGGRAYLHQLYSDAEADYTGRVTVPVLWDTRTHTIVNNESSEIIRMFNSAFDAWGDAGLDLYPADLRSEIDTLNETVFHKVNNGVYRAGFATSQAAYEEAFDDLFATLDELEARLARQRYLLGDRMTEADWRLFTTLLRFDPVYYGHFKCNQRRLVDYPHLWAYTRELYQVPGVAETVNFRHIKHHYYGSHRTINPTGIVPKGPEVDFAEPHGRDALKAA
jgi:putative glutathione S-transferase